MFLVKIPLPYGGVSEKRLPRIIPGAQEDNMPFLTIVDTFRTLWQYEEKSHNLQRKA
jgi:hypothetical protein